MAFCTLSRLWFLLGLLTAFFTVLHKLFVVKPIAFRPRDLSGETYLVTGATLGSIGAETARILASWNANVILGVRSQQKGLDLKASIDRDIWNDMDCTGTVEVVAGLDLSVGAMVRQFVGKIGDKPLHGLINSAGMSTFSETNLSTDAIEMTYAVNHLHPFLLTRLLEPNLIAGALAGGVAGSGKARVVFVSSMSHAVGHIDQELYGLEYKGMHPSIPRLGLGHYHDTKLMNLLTAVEMDARNVRSGTPIVVNAVHPGYVISGLDQHIDFPFLRSIAVEFRGQLGRDTVSGSVTQVTVASSQELNDAPGGKYFEDRCIEDFCRQCLFCKRNGEMGVIYNAQEEALGDEALRAWLWETSSSLVGLQVH